MKKKILQSFSASMAGATGYLIGSTVLKGSRYCYEFARSVQKMTPNVEVKLESDGVYGIRKLDEKPFKVLQLTDMHIGGGYLSRHEDEQALNILYRLIEMVKPDCIVITGDMVCSRAHITWSRNNLNSMRILVELLENIGIPYGVTFGNHDAEPKASHTKREIAEFLCKQRHCLMVKYEQNREISGFSNYPIKLRNTDGSLNSVLYMIDSNEYLRSDKKRGYDYIHEDQVEWYAAEVKRFEQEEGHLVPSFLFFHIPIREYREAWEAATGAKPEAVYYYGNRDEEISCSHEPSQLFDTVLALKSTKGIFCGHDHLNDFSVEYKGVRFTYGQSIDCVLYAKNLSEHKGGTELRISRNGTFTVKARKHRRRIE